MHTDIGGLVTGVNRAGHPVAAVNRCGVQADSRTVTGLYAVTVFNVRARRFCRFKCTGSTAAVPALGITIITILPFLNSSITADY
jgi:hypothetical protein